MLDKSCWPNQSEINEIANLLNIDIDSIKSALDEEERSRIDVEDNHTLILIDIPVDESDDKSSHYTTIPLGIILLENALLTVCTAQTKILNDFIVGLLKSFTLIRKLDSYFKFCIKMQLIICTT